MDLNRVRQLAGLPLKEDLAINVDRDMHIYKLEDIVEKVLKSANYDFTKKIGKPAFDKVIFAVHATQSELQKLKGLLNPIKNAFDEAGLVFTTPEMQDAHIEFTIGERE